MTKPQILVLAGADAAETLQNAGFGLAGEDDLRRQTPAVVIETRGDAGPKAGDLVRSLRSALGPRAGLFFAWTDSTSTYDASVFDGALNSQANTRALSASIHSSLRIAVMADEVRLRFASLEKFGGSPRPPRLVTSGQARVLIFGSPSPKMLSYASKFEAMGVSAVSAFTSYTAFDYLHDGDFDGVIVVGGDETTNTLAFCGALRRNARLFHLPCQVLGSADQINADDALSRGATDFCALDEDEDVTASRLMDLVDEKRSRDAIALAFAAARAPRAIDQGTGLYSSAFFHQHLERLTARAHETDRPLSLALLKIAPDAVINELALGRGLDRLVGQAGAMLSRLVRAEDVAARIDRTTFAVLFPASDHDAARTAGERICAVLECTAYDVGGDMSSYDNDVPIQFKMIAACNDLNHGENHKAFFERTNSQLSANQLPKSEPQ